MLTHDTKPLFPYQQVIDERLVRAFCSGERDVLLHAPCGAGKTTMVQVVATLLNRREGFRGFKGFHTVVIFAPSTTLVEMWRTDYSADDPRPRKRQRYIFRREYGVLEFASEQLYRQDWSEFFRRSFRSQRRVYVCTRALLTNGFLDALRMVEGSKALEGFLFVADESHHCASEDEGQAGNRSGELVSRVLARGGAVLGSTATPWNSSGQVIRQTTHVIDLPLAEYQRQIDPQTGAPFCPRHWEFQPVITKHRTDDASLAVDLPRRRGADGELDEMEEVAPSRARFAIDAALAYVDQWVADACPLAVMRTLTVEAGHRLAAKLKASTKVRRILGRVPRVLNLCGTMEAEQKAAAVKALEHDASVRDYNDRLFDVYVGVTRLDEGTDTKLACCVYMTGIPGSLGYLIQLINRAGRGKWRVDNYPEQWRDRQRLYMFLPRLTEDAQTSVLERYSDVPLAAAIIVQNLELGLRLFNPSASAPRIASKKVAELTDSALQTAVEEAEHRSAWEGDIVAGAQVFAKVMRRLAKRGDKLTIAEVDEVLSDASRKLSEREAFDLKCRVRDHFRATRPDFAQAWAALENRSRKQSSRSRVPRAPQLIREEMLEAWREFVAKYGREVCPPFEKLLTHAASFTGSTSERLVASWGDAYPWPATLEGLIALAKEHGQRYFEKHGKWPSCVSGEVEGLGTTWGALNCALSRHNSSLREVFGRPARVKAGELAQAIRKFIDANGYTPSQTAKNPTERRLGVARRDLGRRHPDLLNKYNIPRTVDRSSVLRRRLGKQQFASVADLVPRFCAQPDANTRTPDIGGDSGNTLDLCLRASADPAKRSQSRGLGGTPYAVAVLCQVNSIARLKAEIFADCWRLTLDGGKKRPWSAILRAGDHVRVVKAERYAFLDWTDLDGAGNPKRKPWKASKV